MIFTVAISIIKWTKPKSIKQRKKSKNAKETNEHCGKKEIE